MKDFYVKLAQETITAYVKTGKKRAGTFVSIHKKDGSLRGCIGTFLPTQKNLAEEIIYNSIAAATQDPRFPPVTEKELTDLEISVDILFPPQPAKRKDLNPKKYGLIVSTQDGRRGLLLPDIPGVKTVEEQIEICRQKAGIGPKEPVFFQIFRVERHGQKW